MRKFVRQNSLGLFFGVIFLLALVGQALCRLEAVQRRAARREPESDLAAAVPDLGKLLDRCGGELAERVPPVPALHPGHCVVAAAGVTGVQGAGPGRSESARDQKIGEHATRPRPSGRGSAGCAPLSTPGRWASSWALIFLLSWFAQSLAGWAAFNETRLQRLQDPLSWAGYLTQRRLLGQVAAELAVRVPGSRLDGRVQHLPSAAGLAGEQACRERHTRAPASRAETGRR